MANLMRSARAAIPSFLIMRSWCPSTVLTLRHSDLPTSYAELHDKGWAHFLPLLVTAAGASS